MKRNVGGGGRILRILAGFLLGLLYGMEVLPGNWGIVALVAGIILMATGLTGFCPLNRMLGINTCHRPHADEAHRF